MTAVALCSATLERFRRVAQRGLHHGPGLADRLGRSWEVDDERAPPHARYAAGEDAERGVRARLHADRLGEAGRLAVDHVERGLGRHVVVREPGPAGGEDESHLLVVGESLEGGRDCLAVVRHRVVDRLEAGLLAEAHERVAGLVVLAPRPRARDREHRRSHAALRLDGLSTIYVDLRVQYSSVMYGISTSSVFGTCSATRSSRALRSCSGSAAT